MNNKILLVEDDNDIAELVELHLKSISYEVERTALVEEGKSRALSNDYALILLDLMLPDGDGMELCRTLRMEKKQTPIVMLTAKSEEIDKVLGLESGADDYITKPFSVREMLARVKAIIRRSSVALTDESPQVLEYGELTIDGDKRKVTLKGQTVDLTKKEFELLYLLAQHPGRNYSREKLLDLIWGYQFEGYDHTVNSHINRLRAKIENNPSKPKYVLTSWGVGYKFNDNL